MWIRIQDFTIDFEKVAYFYANQELVIHFIGNEVPPLQVVLTSQRETERVVHILRDMLKARAPEKIERALDPQTAEETVAVAPVELQGLELYERDTNLCAVWPRLYPVWQKQFPDSDVMALVKRLHAWEVANPTRRKRNRAKAIVTCLRQDQHLSRPETHTPPQQSEGGDNAPDALDRFQNHTREWVKV